jgi:transposase
MLKENESNRTWITTMQTDSPSRMKAVQMGFSDVSEEFWARVAPLVPQRQGPGGAPTSHQSVRGRKPMAPRQVFVAILYVLRTGVPWKALPSRFGSVSTVFQNFRDWQKAGFFTALHRSGLDELEEMEGIFWQWQNTNGVMTKTPLVRPSRASKRRQLS